MTAPCPRCLRVECSPSCVRRTEWENRAAPCTRCGLDCSGSCIKHPLDEHIAPEPRPSQWPSGTQPGTSKLIGSRVVVRYPHIHTRKGESPITETRHAFGRVTNILPDGALWVVTDREGGLRIEAANVEVVT